MQVDSKIFLFEKKNKIKAIFHRKTVVLKNQPYCQNGVDPVSPDSRLFGLEQAMESIDQFHCHAIEKINPKPSSGKS